MAEELKARIKQGFEGYGDPDVLEEVFATDVVIHRPPLPDLVGMEAFKEWGAGVAQAYTNPRIIVHEIIMEGSTGALRGAWQGEHTGSSPLVDVPPTGKLVVSQLCAFFRAENDKIVELWWVQDWLGLFMQIGAVPPLGGGKG